MQAASTVAATFPPLALLRSRWPRLAAKFVEGDRRLSSTSSSSSTSQGMPPEGIRVFVSCLPGLEPILHREIVSLGYDPAPPDSVAWGRISAVGSNAGGREMGCDGGEGRAKGRGPPPTPAGRFVGEGGVGFVASSVNDILRCHLYLGTAGHILLRCTDQPFKARGMEELRRKVSRMAFWRRHFDLQHGDAMPFPRFNVRVSSSKSRLYHTTGIAERVEGGILEALGCRGRDGGAGTGRGNHAGPVIKISVRLYRDYAQISLDTSETPLHRRGYRLQTAKSPLREDLAYALLYGAGWTHRAIDLPDKNQNHGGHLRHLLDPCCGSGTIAIEGAAMAAGLPPGRLRPPPLGGSLLADDAAWHRLLAEAEAEARAHRHCMRACVLGSDRDEGAIAASRGNAERAGVSDLISFERYAVKRTPWLSSPGTAPRDILIATNPPYGIRSSPRKLVLPLYQTIAGLFRRLGSGGNSALALLAHDMRLVRGMKLPNSDVVFNTKHGGIPVFATKARNGNTTQ